MKAVIEWFDMLPDDIREQAINNCIYWANQIDVDVISITQLQVTGLWMALSCSFDWQQTPQGGEYWGEIAFKSLIPTNFKQNERTN